MQGLKVYLPIAAHAKPRGQIGKHGNITHSIGTYRPWQTKVLKYLKTIDLVIPSDFYGIIFVFYLKSKAGHPIDLSNAQGGLEDVLVKGGYIKDDNYKVLKRYATLGIPSEKSYIEFYIVYDKKTFLNLMDKLLP